MTDHTPAAQAAMQEAVRNAIRKAYDDGYNDAKMAPDNCSTYCVQRAEREGSAVLLSKLRAPVADERLSDIERTAITGLISVARAAFNVADDAEDDGDCVKVDRANASALGDALDALDELPDDQPGYSMGPSNKAEWALRRVLGLASAPVAGEAVAYRVGTDLFPPEALPAAERYAEIRQKPLDPLYAAPQASSVAGEAQEDLAPPKCPITGRPFFMALEHPELGMVPTYGGPYDSYTIPYLGGKPDQPWHERDLRVYRYDHDLGGWIADETEVIPLRIVHEDVLHGLEDAAPQASESVVVQFAGVGSAGPFPVVDKHVTLPEVTMRDLAQRLAPQASEAVAAEALEVAREALMEIADLADVDADDRSVIVNQALTKIDRITALSAQTGAQTKENDS